MELRRKILDKLMDWKKNKGKECLILYGPRQVGKTTIVKKFGESYESFIKIDFIESPHLKRIFQINKDEEVELSSENILKRISANIRDAKLIPGKTLIFIDEIQKCAETGVEIEVFGHGALCVSVSGQCLDIPVLSLRAFRVVVLRLNIAQFPIWETLQYGSVSVPFIAFPPY